MSVFYVIWAKSDLKVKCFDQMNIVFKYLHVLRLNLHL